MLGTMDDLNSLYCTADLLLCKAKRELSDKEVYMNASHNLVVVYPSDVAHLEPTQPLSEEHAALESDLLPCASTLRLLAMCQMPVPRVAHFYVPCIKVESMDTKLYNILIRDVLRGLHRKNLLQVRITC